MRLIGPLRRPLALAMSLGEGVLEVALTVIREVRSALDDGPAATPEAAGPPAPAATSRVRRSRPAPSPKRRPRSAARTPGPAQSTPAAPAGPPASEKVKTVDDAPVPVAQFGGEGAEEDAGAEVRVAEPWDGYAAMNAAQVRNRLEGADRETLAAVVLYEGFGKSRSSVIQTAERRLTRLSAPRS